MPQGYEVDTDAIIDYINERVALTGARPINQDIADQFGIGKSSVTAITSVHADRINGTPTRAGRPVDPDEQAEACKQTMNFIQHSIEGAGWAPSQREIADHLNTSANRANRLIAILAADGLIEVGPAARQIRIVGSSMKMPEVTL